MSSKTFFTSFQALFYVLQVSNPICKNLTWFQIQSYSPKIVSYVVNMNWFQNIRLCEKGRSSMHATSVTIFSSTHTFTVGRMIEEDFRCAKALIMRGEHELEEEFLNIFSHHFI